MFSFHTSLAHLPFQLYISSFPDTSVPSFPSPSSLYPPFFYNFFYSSIPCPTYTLPISHLLTSPFLLYPFNFSTSSFHYPSTPQPSISFTISLYRNLIYYLSSTSSSPARSSYYNFHFTPLVIPPFLLPLPPLLTFRFQLFHFLLPLSFDLNMNLCDSLHHPLYLFPSSVFMPLEPSLISSCGFIHKN